MEYVIVSQNGRTQYRPQNTITLRGPQNEPHRRPETSGSAVISHGEFTNNVNIFIHMCITMDISDTIGKNTDSSILVIHSVFSEAELSAAEPCERDHLKAL